jgi:two-component system KDP operon response regulator KdpE
MAAERAPALVLLNLGLPDADGTAAIPRPRASTAARTLVLSARDRGTEKMAALDAGGGRAEKPFALAELLAQVRAALRQAAAATGGPDVAAPVLRAGPLEVVSARRAAGSR